LSVRENPVSARLLDRERSQLIYVGASAVPELWDSLWALDAEAVANATAPNRDGAKFVRMTSRYLQPSDGVILEGGCGAGQFVAALRRGGFQSVGLDFAPATVRALNEHAPELDIRLGDLRSIPLPDASVAGYWSIGVIEHFWDGYRPLATEMARVVKSGGYLFCSFPFMNSLRSLKARLGLYPSADFKEEPRDFYQFALRHTGVIDTMAEYGFSYVTAHRSSGLKGILGELGGAEAPLEWLYSYGGSSFLVRGLRRICDAALSALGTPHSILLVFRREPRRA
jgi:SAM-dependent methyltransferase